MAGNGLNSCEWLESSGNRVNGWYSWYFLNLEITGNRFDGRQMLEMAENIYNWIKNGWKLKEQLEMAKSLSKINWWCWRIKWDSNITATCLCSFACWHRKTIKKNDSFFVHVLIYIYIYIFFLSNSYETFQIYPMYFLFIPRYPVQNTKLQYCSIKNIKIWILYFDNKQTN